ncbi:TPA: NTPase KAP [Pseudomonas aeruginosa]|uniref:KAP family P-loop NTPase fold protein n=1 Tax=Pseudomonas aeruginosa TaxID=287 RepID=UPI00053D0CD5|nr:P-loop NTPase fold protein [Pseudomonas aeruginosa]MBN0172339.1 NTPase KAP [Pseudomonas aeruginosa]HBO4864586.1 NTPase KAP [Pseudomonas aeruginosa]HDR2984889.1 NTPase KAP [Pseudomonas aeruginosa]HEP8674690.1 NTPase KAP [Pseudomonas aeruginosa]
MSESSRMMPATLDREISSVDQDAFGHRHFAQGLQSLIESEQLTPPFSIGLLGGWGTGKSSIKELYTRNLADDTVKVGGRHRKDRYHCITFNAWRFGGHDQDIKRALLRHVFLELGGKEEQLYDRLFRQTSKTTHRPKGWCKVTLETLKAWALPIPALVAAMALLFLICYLVLIFFNIQSDLLKSIAFLCVTGAYTYLLKHVKPAAVAPATPITRVELPNTTSEQYEDLLLEQVRRYKSGECKSLDGRTGKTCERLVVFVDDLDRLSAEEMVLGLDAVRTFMEIPATRLPVGLGLVFVISCDEAKVADALARGRRNSDLPGTVVTHNDARRYLDRIFQFRLEIPPPPRHDMRQFARSHLEKLPSIIADLKARDIPLATVIDRMIHVGVQDPRNALQIVNAFAQAWWLARKREAEGLGSNRAGGLHEGAVTSHPVSLGALCAMKVSFPDFYRDLQEDPAFLQRFTDVVIRGQKLGDQPLQTQDRLKERYFKEVGEEFVLKSDHRPLRQFIASLIGLRWPSSLQSLLLLSEDHITRRLGAKIAPIYGDFVSGNTQGVLEGLARHNDTAPLHEDEARALYQMLEDLRHELPELRARASRVIADLVDRLPDPPAYQLISMLCREMADSLDLRSQLGLDKISKILQAAAEVDQRTIASRLVEDLLTGPNPVRLLRETMEAPSLDEAVEMVRSAVPMILTVRKSYGLERQADAQLCNWLLERTVAVGTKSTQLAFGELEQWLDESNEQLVADLGLNYINALADELEKKQPPQFETAASVDRTRKILRQMMTQGAESRELLWAPLVRYVSLYDESAIRMAWEIVVENHRYASDDDVCHFFDNFVERLSRAYSDEYSTLDNAAAATALLALTHERVEALDAESIEAGADLADLWGKSGFLPEEACMLLSELRRNDETDFMRVIGGWAPKLLVDLPKPCVSLIATQFSDLPKATKSAVASSLSALLNTEPIPESLLARFKTFSTNAPGSVWDSDPLQSFLNTLMQHMAAQVSAGPYLKSVLPATVHLLHHATPSTFGSCLQQLFVNGKNYPGHYSWLHSKLADYWPKESNQLTGYDPQVIFDEASTFASLNPSQTKQGILRSMRQMIERGLVGREERSKLIAAACSAWSADPLVAADIFGAGYTDVTPEQAANLVTSIDWDNEKHLNALQIAWKAVAANDAGPQDQETLMAILQKGPLGNTDSPDLAVRMWAEVQTDFGQGLMRQLLVKKDLNDGSRRRLWAFSMGHAKDFGADFFLEIIPQISALNAVDETVKAIFDDFSEILSVVSTKELQADMANRLMSQFTHATTNTTKGRIAEICNRLCGQGALKGFKPEALHKDEYDILFGHFGARPMKRFEKLLIE